MSTSSEVEISLIQSFIDTRDKTLEIVKTLESDDYTIQTEHFTSPPKWHMGHVSWIYEAIMDKIDSNYEYYSREFVTYLNSYYQQFGTPHDKGRRGIVSRPTTSQILEYFEIITQRTKEFIKEHTLTSEQMRLLMMGCHHECQHQELLIYDLQHMLGSNYRPVKINNTSHNDSVVHKQIAIKGGMYTMGYSGKDYCYDIELPEHKVFLNDYTIDAYPVTNGSYMQFMRDGGYETYKYWLADGWEKVKTNNWKAPMYWEMKDDKWYINDFAGPREIDLDEPVCHVSYYEADAYAKWAKRRLPTEAEWEKAACWNDIMQEKTIFPWGNDPPDESRCNLLESHNWRCTKVGSFPDGVSPSGCHQMIGDVWEWTSSEFMGYPGFKSGFDEYNDKWFTNQKVLRGGSFATPSMSIRASYRNFFRLDERWMFAGFRCAD